MNADGTAKRYLGLCIGAQKCGTSSLHDYLKSSLVPLANEKEHKAWLGMDPVIGWSDFAGLMQRSLQSTGLFVEIDPDLALFPSEVRKVVSLADGAEVRLLFLYRDPAERIWSQYAMNSRRGHEARPLPDALREVNGKITRLDMVRYSYLRRSAYASLLSDLGNYLSPTTQVTVASLEELKTRPARICREWLPPLASCDLPSALPLSNRGGMSAVPKLSRWLNSDPSLIKAGKRTFGRGSLVARRFRHFRAWLETTRKMSSAEPDPRVPLAQWLVRDWEAFQGLLTRDPITLPLASFVVDP